MSQTPATILFIIAMIAALVATYRPLGNYMARVFTSGRHLRTEKVIFRVGGIDPDAEQPWPTYLRSVLAFSLISCLFLYLFLRIQHHLFLSLGFSGMSPDLSFNTAASFVANTNWQAYSGESAAGYLVQMAGLAVQNFVSAAVGISVAIALIRGFTRRNTDKLGNFWTDLTRTCVRILLPIAILMAVIFVAGGMLQNFHDFHTVTTLAGAKQSIPGGPVASQEAIKLLGTNGGGFFNANSAHPFENPTSWTNFLEIYLILAIGFSLPRAFGIMIGDKRQGRLIASVMAGLALVSVILTVSFQLMHHGTVPTAVNAATEGTETRFGVGQSGVFATATTLTSTGAVDSFHDSYTSLGGMMTLLNMGLGEVAPGGVGSGLYGMLILAILTVFVAGLMIGRTPEYLGKKLSGREIKFASLYILATPACVLIGTAASLALPGPRSSMLNAGPHGLSEVLYAYMSGANNNGSAFAGLAVDTTWYNTTIGLAMLIARFLPMVFVIALAGSLAKQRPVPESAGTLPTFRPQFAGMLAGVTLIVVLLTYLPVVALGPLAEGLHR